jgi:hypothetical protein
MDYRWIQRNNRGLLLLILVGAAILRLLYIDQPFADVISWRQADNAIITANFSVVISISSCRRSAGTGRVRIMPVTNFS